jgi:hypothetical protein
LLIVARTSRISGRSAGSGWSSALEDRDALLALSAPCAIAGRRERPEHQPCSTTPTAILRVSRR